MKPFIVILLAFCFHFFSNGQTDNKLLIHTQNIGLHTLSVVDFQNQSVTPISTALSHDLAICGKKIVFGYPDLLIYDHNFSILDTISAVDAIKMKSWGDKICIVSNQSPIFRVYDLNTGSLIFALDTNYLPLQIYGSYFDMEVTADKAFLAYDRQITVIDLIQQDTIGSFQTPDYFWGMGFNTFIVEHLGLLYLVTDYATGAPRFSLNSFDPDSYIIDSIIHVDFYHLPYRPVSGSKLLWLASKPGYYDPVSDSLSLPVNYNNIFPLAFDAIYDNVVWYDMLQNKLEIDTGGGLSEVIVTNSIVDAELLYDTSSIGVNTITEYRKDFVLYPNPARDWVVISKKDNNTENLQIEVYDYTMKLLLKRYDYRQGEKLDFDFKSGLYFVRVNEEGKQYTVPLVVY